LFSNDVTCERLTQRFENGATIKRTPLTEQFGLRDFQAMYGPTAIPLFLVGDNRVLHVFSSENRPTPRPGHVLISLVDPESDRPDSVFDSGPVMASVE
jgi:hypothetical protein